jgi:hypothetical protein
VGLLREALPASTLVIAVDPGKVNNRVWLSSSAAGMAVEPLPLPVLRPGLEALQRLVLEHLDGTDPVFAIEATGGLHQVWVRELDRRFPGCRCGCSPRRRPPPPARSWARVSSRPTTGTAPR